MVYQNSAHGARRHGRLPHETVTFLDVLKERQGLRNHGQVLKQLIEKGRTAAQQ